MSERSFDDFDDFAANYRTIHSENVKLSGADSLYFAQHKINQIAKRETASSLSMLDVGCGDGAVEFFASQRFPGWQIEAIDVSEKSIEEARLKDLPNVHFATYNGKTIPYNNDSFDVVFIAAVLHHIDFACHADFIREVFRVLKIGGRVYIFEHNPLNPATRYLVKTCVFDKDARLLGHQYAKQLLKSGSFKSVEQRFILFFPRSKVFSFLLPLEDKLGWLPLGAQYYLRAVK